MYSAGEKCHNEFLPAGYQQESSKASCVVSALHRMSRQHIYCANNDKFVVLLAPVKPHIVFDKGSRRLLRIVFILYSLFFILDAHSSRPVDLTKKRRR